MKKFKYLWITMILLLSCLGMNVFAKDSAVTFSEDLQKLYVDGSTYSRYDTSMLEIDSYIDLYEEVVLSETQQETIKKVSLESNDYKNIIFATFSFYDGSELSVEFLKDEYITVLEDILSGTVKNYSVDFEWPEGNIVKTDGDAFLGSATTLTSDELSYCDYFKVVTERDDARLRVMKGSVISVNDKVYYVDFAAHGIENFDEFDPYNLKELNVYEITDKSFLSELKAAEETYYGDDLGFFLDDDFSEKISVVFLIVAFAVIPLIIFLIFLFLAFRSKTVYRKLFGIISILSGAELVVFAVVAVLGAVLR